MDAMLAEAPGAKPVAKPLTHTSPAVIARELPNGRGFLRVVGGSASQAKALPAPGPALVAPAAPATPTVQIPSPVAAGPAGQLDLLAWTPPPPPAPVPVKSRRPVQLNLFGLEGEPEK